MIDTCLIRKNAVYEAKSQFYCWHYDCLYLIFIYKIFGFCIGKINSPVWIRIHSTYCRMITRMKIFGKVNNRTLAINTPPGEVLLRGGLKFNSETFNLTSYPAFLFSASSYINTTHITYNNIITKNSFSRKGEENEYKTNWTISAAFNPRFSLGIFWNAGASNLYSLRYRNSYSCNGKTRCWHSRYQHIDRINSMFL